MVIIYKGKKKGKEMDNQRDDTSKDENLTIINQMHGLPINLAQHINIIKLAHFEN